MKLSYEAQSWPDIRNWHHSREGQRKSPTTNNRGFSVAMLMWGRRRSRQRSFLRLHYCRVRGNMNN